MCRTQGCKMKISKYEYIAQSVQAFKELDTNAKKTATLFQYRLGAEPTSVIDWQILQEEERIVKYVMEMEWRQYEQEEETKEKHGHEMHRVKIEKAGMAVTKNSPVLHSPFKISIP